MKYKNSQLKAMAREALRGKYSPILASFLLYGFISICINVISTLLFQKQSAFTHVIRWIFSFVISLILCIFDAGLDRIYLNTARHKEVRVSDLFYLFNNHPDRAIIAGLAITLVSTLASLPLTISLFTTPELLGESLDMLYRLMGFLLLTMALSFLLELPFSFTYFVLGEAPDVGAKKALCVSMKLAFHNFGRLIKLYFSFLGLIILSAFTMYIGLLWVIPYLKTSLACLYLDCGGELIAPTYEHPHTIPAPGDDFNSEA